MEPAAASSTAAFDKVMQANLTSQFGAAYEKFVIYVILRKTRC